MSAPQPDLPGASTLTTQRNARPRGAPQSFLQKGDILTNGPGARGTIDSVTSAGSLRTGPRRAEFVQLRDAEGYPLARLPAHSCSRPGTPIVESSTSTIASAGMAPRAAALLIAAADGAS